MGKPSSDELDKNPVLERPTDTWPNFANNFLYKFFEGRSLPIWLFVSGMLIVLYGRYATFDNSLVGNCLKYASFIFLVFLLIWTLFKNIIVINPLSIGDRIRLLINLPITYKPQSWIANVIGDESTKLDLPLKIINFKKIYAKVRIIEPGDGRWRAGFVFNSVNGKREYIFHAYQDRDNPTFRARILEREPGVQEIPDDTDKQIGIASPRNFVFWVESNKNNLEFYIENILVGNYKVPLDKISNIQIAAWSDKEPIRILFEDIEAKA